MSSIIEKIKSLFNTEVKFKDVKDSEGNNLRITEDENGAPTKVEVIAEDGTLTAPKEGDITMEDGSILTVDAEGNVTKVTEAVKEDAEKTDATSGDTKTEKASKVNFKDFAAYATDKNGKMIYTTDEVFEIGSPVFIFDMDTYEMIPASSDVETAGGSVYKIVDGKIETIEKAGEAPEVEAKTEDMSKVTEQITQLTEAVNFLAEKLSKIETVKKEIEVKKDEEVIKLNKTLKDLMVENEKLSKQPASNPISTKKIEKDEFKKQSSLSELLANNKAPEKK